ncbi:hypothetical protein [Variovorax sp. DXTD-1]|uniref:hypothetical protein n=1 Tax=Variovorax sp. DXTD-1 TaxID=2495592 RepID=UPI000F860D6E|nr:hypothetical protein [Variovorax sp. DXTD-1]RST46320.1 hypothetical protein EJI00_21570 [Variovorax sp. DXTD-1]
MKSALPQEPAPSIESPASRPIPVWLGRYAAWGMPLAYILIVALAAIGLKVPAIAFKVFLGGGAFWQLRVLLKKEPGNRYFLIARKVVGIQLGLMLCVEVLSGVAVFALPSAMWPMAGGASVFVGFILHILVAIWGSFRLRAVG